MNNQIRFKGPAYYEETDADIFYGRDDETQDLFRLVMHSDFSVCYAESGEGKSSLINAGLLPVMRKNGLLPIRISFNDYEMNGESGDNAACNFDKIVLDKIDNEIAEQNKKDKNNHIEFFKIMLSANQEDLDKKAWWRLRFMEIRRNHYECLTPVIIIDQFEEFFTRARSINWIDDFFGWLEELYNNVSHTPGMEGVSAPKRFKVLLSLRSDYVSELDYWGMTKHFIPSLKNNRYCLKALTKKAAREIAQQLSGLSDESYEKIIKSAKSSQIGDWDSIKDGLPCVSALALSLILTGLSEDDSLSKEKFLKSGNNVVTEYSDGERTIRKILEMFCEKVWKECNISAGHRYIIERALINEQGHRQPVRVEDESLHKIRFSELYLKKLTQTRLLRENNGYIELAHDSLCEMISNDVNEYEAQQKFERERREYRKRFVQVVCALLFIAAVVGCAIWLWRRHVMVNNLRRTESRYYSAQAQLLINQGDVRLAQLLLLEALPIDISHPNRPLVGEAELQLRIANNQDCYRINANSGNRYAYFCPDGKCVITGSYDGTVKIWDVQTAKCLKTIYGKDVFNARYSPDHNYILTICGWAGWSCDDPEEFRDIQIWDAHSGELVKTLKGHKQAVYDALFSPSGQQIISTSWDGTIRIWDVSTGKCVRVIGDEYNPLTERHFGVSLCVGVSPDGKKLLSTYNHNEIEIWDVENGICEDTLKGHMNTITKINYSNDGRYIVSSSLDGTAKLWNVQTKECIMDISFHTNSVSDISFSHDDKYIVSASSDSLIQIWNVKDGTCERKKKMQSVVYAASFNAMDDKIVISVNDRTTWIWEWNRNRCDRLVDDKDIYIYENNIDVLPNQNQVALNSQTGLSIFNIDTPQERYYLPEARYISSVMFSPDGGYIMVIRNGFTHSQARVWDLNKKMIVSEFSSPKPFICCRWSEDGKKIISVTDSIINIRLANTAEVVSDIIFNKNVRLYNKFEISHDLSKFAIISNDSLQVFDLGTGHRLYSVSGKHYGDIVTKLCFSPNDEYLISASGKGSINVWRCADGIHLRHFDGSGNMIKDLSFDNDNEFFVSTDNKGNVDVWKIDGDVSYSHFQSHDENLILSRFAPNGRQILSISANGGLYRWDFPPLQELIDKTRKLLENRQLTPEELKKYYLE
jgi:WD40 repeat protein